MRKRPRIYEITRVESFELEVQVMKPRYAPATEVAIPRNRYGVPLGHRCLCENAHKRAA